MLEPNSQSAPSRVSRVRHVKDSGLPRLPGARDMQLDRPIGVTIISVIYFIVGGGVWPGLLVLLTALYSWIWGVALLLLLLAAGFILTAVGLWRLRNWGLVLAIISSIVILLSSLTAAVQGSYLNLVLALAEVVILFYLVQPKVRAHFK